MSTLIQSFNTKLDTWQDNPVATLSLRIIDTQHQHTIRCIFRQTLVLTINLENETQATVVSSFIF